MITFKRDGKTGYIYSYKDGKRLGRIHQFGDEETFKEEQKKENQDKKENTRK